MDVYQKYELIELLSTRRGKSFRAREIATGRSVVVHFLAGEGNPESEALLARLKAVEPFRLVEVGGGDSEMYVVTTAPPFQSLADWFDERNATGYFSLPPSRAPSGAIGSVPVPPPPRLPPPLLQPGEYTRLISGVAPQREQPPFKKTPLTFDFSQCQVCIPLRSDFTFRHEPTRAELDDRYIGRKQDINELAARIIYSPGDTFLLTGFRGVGKTSFINQVIHKVHEIVEDRRSEHPSRLVDIYMSLPRRVQPVELMHHIVRRLYERLDELGILNKLDPSLQDRIALAYKRTSLVVSQHKSEIREISLTNEAGWELPAGKASWKLPFQFKRSRSQTTDASYIAYDERSAEHDIIQIARQLTNGYRPSWWGRVFRRELPVRLKVLFVFDELDKLDAADLYTEQEVKTQPAPAPIDLILRSVKTLLTTSRMSFVFVAGKDLYDRWLEDVGTGDSIYESIFAYDKYLSCMWFDVKQLAGGVVDLKPLTIPAGEHCRKYFEAGALFCEDCGKYLQDGAKARDVYDAFLFYLSYRGRGIPRRIWRTFHQAVKWYNGRPVLAFSAQEIQQHQVYAELWKLVNQFERDLFDEEATGLLSEGNDGPRLAIYYLIDWILRRGASTFEESDIISWSKTVSAKIMPSALTGELLIKRLIKLLVKAGVVQDVTPQANAPHRIFRKGSAIKVEDFQPAAPRRYRLDPRRRNNLGNGISDLPEDVGLARDERTERECGGYTIVQTLGAGGMARVYRAIQQNTGKECALKVLEPGAMFDNEFRERFRREARILADVQHPNIVRFYGSGEDASRLYIAMELLDGIELESILTAGESLTIDQFLAICTPVIDALRYLHANSLVRNDLKPSNIMITSAGRVCLIDLGTTKRIYDEKDLTAAGLVIGTPNYIAPEQVVGTEIDQRCDIYALGAVMYRMITGRTVFEQNGIEAQLHAVLTNTPLPPSRHIPSISPALEVLILKCLEKDPHARPQSAEEVQAALQRISWGTTADLKHLVATTKRKQENIQRSAAAVTVAFPSQSAPPRASTGGEFTRMFSAPLTRVSAPTPPPSLSQKTSVADRSASVTGPGEFTKMFGPRPKENPRRIAAGEFTLLWVANTPGQKGPELTIVDGPTNKNERHAMTGSRLTIGREVENDLVLPDESVSRFHAEILRDGSGFWIEDKGSSDGTKHNGVSINGQQTLLAGDRINIGRYSLRFEKMEESAGNASEPSVPAESAAAESTAIG